MLVGRIAFISYTYVVKERMLLILSLRNLILSTRPWIVGEVPIAAACLQEQSLLTQLDEPLEVRRSCELLPIARYKSYKSEGRNPTNLLSWNTAVSSIGGRAHSL